MAIASATVSYTIIKAPGRTFIVLVQNTSLFVQNTSLLVHLVSGVVLKYGKDSWEYEMTGRVHKSDAWVGLRLRICKATITRLKSTADLKAAAKQTA